MGDWNPLVGISLAFLSLLVSIGTALYAAIQSRRISYREVTAALISDYYASLRALTELQMREWRLSHLFEVAENYDAVVAQLRRIAPPAGSEEAVELALKERAAAITMFGLYEHVIYQLHEAASSHDRARVRFLEEAAYYFTSRLLANPRLRYLWHEDGGNLGSEFEEPTREHYRRHVGTSRDAWDAVGPYTPSVAPQQGGYANIQAQTS